MSDLRMISVSTVRPSNINRSNRDRIELTPWDLLLLDAEYTQRGLLFKNSIPPQDTLISHLKSALSLILGIYSPFAGRLVKIENDDGTSCFHISCDASGVRFVHSASESLSVAEIRGSGLVSGFNHGGLFPMNGVKNFQGVSEPLLAVQITDLSDGFFIAFGFNHTVADGSSFWRFVEAWSKLSLRSDQLTDLKPLVPRRWFLEGTDPPIPVTFSASISEHSPLVALQETVFHFTREAISELKAKSNREIGEIAKISSLQALIAHLWRSITRHRTLNPNQEVNCRLLVNMRPRLNPPLEEECFGNVILFGTTSTTGRELLNRGLGWAASKLNQMVASQTNQEARNFPENWAENMKIRNIVGGNTSVVVAGSPRFNVYGCDFGSGAPVAVRAGPGNYSDGKLVVFPGAEEGSVDVQISLLPETLKGLFGDEDFMAILAFGSRI